MRLVITRCIHGAGTANYIHEELNGVLLKPSIINGRFTIFFNDEKFFDRKEQQRFPEIKELKQLVRDKAAPEKFLGHSDNK